MRQESFADQVPAKFSATLLDEGLYHCSIRTMYMILDDTHEVKERVDRFRPYSAASFGWEMSFSRCCGNFQPSNFDATRVRSTCAVPPPMVNIRTSRAMRSMGKFFE